MHLLSAFALTSLSLVLPAQQWDQMRNPSSSSSSSSLKLPLRLAKIIRNPNHLAICQDRVNRVNRLVTAAYLFSRYIFVHSYDDDDDAFNADTFMTDSFFTEVLRSLQTRTRRDSKDENTLQNHQLIIQYCEEFCQLYRYQLIMIPGIASTSKPTLHDKC